MEISCPSLKRKNKSHATTVACGEQLSVYFTANWCTDLSACCLQRQIGTGSESEIGNGTGSGTGSETACSEQVEGNVSEIWSGTWTWTLSETLSGTLSGRGICLTPDPLRRPSSLGCDS